LKNFLQGTSAPALWKKGKMALTFKIETQPGYLLMIYEGLYEPSLAGEFTDQILAACKSHQPAKLLIDLRKVEGKMSTMDRFNLSVLAATKYFGAKLTGKIPSCRYAIVGSHPLVDSKRFEETVAVNRGVNIKVFTVMKEALIWLEVEGPGE
jgi:hypothetical protein